MLESSKNMEHGFPIAYRPACHCKPALKRAIVAFSVFAASHPEISLCRKQKHLSGIWLQMRPWFLPVLYASSKIESI
jgi:hypothetical protein